MTGWTTLACQSVAAMPGFDVNREHRCPQSTLVTVAGTHARKHQHQPWSAGQVPLD